MSSKQVNVKRIALYAAIAIVLIIIIINMFTTDKHGGDFTMKIPGNEQQIEANIKAVNLYVDFSGSMRGFVDGKNTKNPKAFEDFNAKMVSVVSYGLTNLASRYKIAPQSHCGNKSYNNDGFREAMEKHTVFNENITLLHNMFQSGFSTVTDSTVNIVLSDMVLSYGSKKLKDEKNLEYNKQHLDDLSGSVYDVFVSFKDKKRHFVLLQYYSDYNGYYYCNYRENLSRKKNGEFEIVKGYDTVMMKERPFYIMLCGTESNLRSIMNNHCFEGYDNVYATFNLPEPNQQPFAVTPSSMSVWNVGKVDTIMGTVWSDNDDRDHQEQITVSCKAFRIPTYVKLSENIEFGGDAIENVFASNDCFDPNAKEYRFAVRLKPYQNLKKESYVWFSLITDEGWMESASTKNDICNNPSMIQKKTWGFDALIGALNKAYFDSKSRQPQEIARFDFMVSNQ